MSQVASSETSRDYDVVVIGAGPVGENVADRTRAAGLSTVIVESELIGGECSYWACEPSNGSNRFPSTSCGATRASTAPSACR